MRAPDAFGALHAESMSYSLYLLQFEMTNAAFRACDARRSVILDRRRSLSRGLLVLPLADLPILREAVLCEVGFLEPVRAAGDDLRRRDRALERRAAVGAAFERRVGHA